MSDTNSQAEACQPYGYDTGTDLIGAIDALLTEHGYAAVLVAIEAAATIADGIPDANRRRLVAAIRAARVTATHAEKAMAGSA
jgi:hypothetical protein